MPENDSDSAPESDLPDPSSAETFTDLDGLKQEMSGDEESADGSDTVRMTFHVDEGTAERLRNAVYWTGAFVTLSGTARDALRAAVQRLEERFNDGEPFPDRDEELKGGNPNLKE